MKRCVHCRGENRDQARFCGHCGKPFSEQPLPASTTTPPEKPRKYFFGTRSYAVLTALGWLTLFTPFVTLRACDTQVTLWGMDLLSDPSEAGRESVSRKDTLTKSTMPPVSPFETALKEMQAEQEKKSQEQVEEFREELYKEAPFYLRFLLSIDPIPFVSYPLLLFAVGLAWLHWYRPIDWLCVTGLIVCLHTILNIKLHNHLFTTHTFPFGLVEISTGWGLVALSILWGVLYALNRFQRWAVVS